MVPGGDDIAAAVAHWFAADDRAVLVYRQEQS